MSRDKSYMHLYTDESIGSAQDGYMELDSERWQTKAIYLYKDGRVEYAYDDTEQGTFLAEAQYPEPEEVNGIEGCEGAHLEYITEEEFYRIWNKYVEK